MPKLHTTRLLLVTALFAATSQAQTHRVEKPENVIRSIGVYEWTGDLAKPNAARLIPVSLFIDNEYKDGGTYYARPVPLALLNGNIYSLEKAGIPQGTITLDYARHLQSATSSSDNITDLGWFGYGTYATMPVPRKAAPLRASTAPPVIVSSKDPDRPTFADRHSDTTKPATGGKQKQPDASVTPTGDSASDDPDRPHFGKAPTPTSKPDDPASTTPASTTPTSTTPTDTTTKPSTTKPSDPTADTDRPTLRHRDPRQAEADRKARSHGSVTAADGSLNDDPDRPNMRRGATAGIGGKPSPQLTGMPAGLHQIVAVSDPVNREPHPFAREWSTPTEQAEVLAKLQTMAREQLIAYARQNGADQPPPPTPTKRTPAAATRNRRPAPAPPAAPLTNEELTPYTLSYGGLPTFVYTAISGAPPANTAAPSIPERYVTLVAQELPSGELQLAFSTVTDAAHLDRTPWFRLVDAVDPDDAHRASLLFELRGHTSRQFALYRILSAKADQIFVTNPTD